MRARSMAAVPAAILLGVMAALAVGVGPAAAHVTVNPNAATQGGFAKLTFRVPNESDSASTVKLEVTIPAETAIASVSVRPIPGWTATVEKATLATPIKVHDSEVTEAVSKIIWVATGDAAVKPGQFQEFEISAGPLPEVDQIVFKALQTYSDNNIVRWIDPPAADGAEVENPAPVLKLSKSGAQTTNAGATVQAESVPADSGDSRSGWALILGVAGLIAGLAGLGVALLNRRSTSSG